MVQQMQSAVSAGVMEMDRFTDHVRRNVKDVATISQQMADIIEQVNSNTTQFESVNESMQSQAQGADQISQRDGPIDHQRHSVLRRPSVSTPVPQTICSRPSIH